MPFRDAHHVTGALVKMAEDKGCDLHELTLAEMQGVHADITDAVFGVLSVENSGRIAARLMVARPRCGLENRSPLGASDWRLPAEPLACFRSILANTRGDVNDVL